MQRAAVRCEVYVFTRGSVCPRKCLPR